MKVWLDFLAFVWYHRLFKMEKLKSIQGQEIRIVKQKNNLNPSFNLQHEATLLIQGISFEGLVLLIGHKSQVPHSPHKRKPYILCLVYEWENTDVPPDDLPILHLAPILHHLYKQRYLQLLQSPQYFACASFQHRVDPVYKYFWLGRMTIEALEKQVLLLQKQIFYLKGHWRSWCWYRLTIHFLQMPLSLWQEISLCLPFSKVLEHAVNPTQLYAYMSKHLLIPPAPAGSTDHHHVLKEKDIHAFPNTKNHQIHQLHQRIVWWILACPDPNQLFDQILACETVHDFIDCFPLHPKSMPEGLCIDHPSAPAPFFPSFGQVIHILIQIIAPMLYLFGKLKQEYSYIYKCLHLLESIQYEQTIIIKRKDLPWDQPFFSAAECHAIDHMYENYCACKRCLHCAIGQQLVLHG
jgi:hypothetical protein